MPYKAERIFILYMPWVFSILFSSMPVMSYLIAWLGSFFIFFMCYTGHIKPLPTDRSIGEQIMRPIFLVQIIFIGYMACSSIFYFFNLLGFGNLDQTGDLYDQAAFKMPLLAQCQRYYILGHAAFVTGIMVFMKYPVQQKYYYQKDRLHNVIFIIAIICLPVSALSLRVPGLAQFYFQLSALSFIAGTLALAFAIPLKKMGYTAVCGLLYVSNFYQALMSGFKEPIIISVLVLGIFLYPSYKTAVKVIFVPILMLLFFYLPTYNQVFRQNAWTENANTNEAYELALDATLNPDEEISNWGFLVFRLSEVDMFTTFIQSTPGKVDYYGFQLVEQSAAALVPRVFWPGKPNTEEMIMERVYDAGVVMRNSNVSAKPAYIVDGYLSGGIIGVFLSLFVYGAMVQIISQKAEQLFGGYILGTALIFSGLFQIFWRGLSFEFISNSVFWSFITMLIVHRILVGINFLKRI
ncbi:exosortase Y-associated Wzy-like protein [Mucilaginibacter phyllosphaerae]